MTQVLTRFNKPVLVEWVPKLNKFRIYDTVREHGMLQGKYVLKSIVSMHSAQCQYGIPKKVLESIKYQ